MDFEQNVLPKIGSGKKAHCLYSDKTEDVYYKPKLLREEVKIKGVKVDKPTAGPWKARFLIGWDIK